MRPAARPRGGDGAGGPSLPADAAFLDSAVTTTEDASRDGGRVPDAHAEDSGESGTPDSGAVVTLIDGGAALACAAGLSCCSDAGAQNGPTDCPLDWASAQSCAYAPVNSTRGGGAPCDGLEGIAEFLTETAYLFVFDATSGALLARVAWDMGSPEPPRPASMTCDAVRPGVLLSSACVSQFFAAAASATTACNPDAGLHLYCASP